MVSGPHTDQVARDTLDDLGLVVVYLPARAGGAADGGEVMV